MDEEQQKHAEELSQWKKEAKASQDKVSVLCYADSLRCCDYWAHVRKKLSANSKLNFNPGFFFFLSKALSWIIFSILFRVSNHQMVGKEN